MTLTTGPSLSCPCCHVSSLCRYDLGGFQGSPIWPLKGQMEAGLSIGLTWVVKPFGGLSSPLSRGSSKYDDCHLEPHARCSFGYTIGFIDIMGAGNNLISRNLGNYSLETYTAVAVIYWGIALVISFSAQLLEKRLSVTEGSLWISILLGKAFIATLGGVPVTLQSWSYRFS